METYFYKMTQDILTYIIINLAIAYTIYSFYKSIIVKKKGISGCSGCSKSCEIKKVLAEKVK
ncbi:MAG: hypothetical protein A2033_09205 [Bacteroidetes bacterium GWA2_31_9]|nr:MAG: hypothetical protein A2033_09205 [Bacteroidetes bacterium GWA2_31_9]